MGTISEQLLKQKRPFLSDAQKSGIKFELNLTRGDVAAFELLAGRYFDADLLWSNMDEIGQLDVMSDDPDDPLCPVYEIDASALLLAFFCTDNGLSSLASGDLKRQIGEATSEAFNSENSVLDEIRCYEDPELQGDDDQDNDQDDDTPTGEYEAIDDSQNLGSGDDWEVDTEATEGD